MLTKYAVKLKELKMGKITFVDNEDFENSSLLTFKYFDSELEAKDFIIELYEEKINIINEGIKQLVKSINELEKIVNNSHASKTEKSNYSTFNNMYDKIYNKAKTKIKNYAKEIIFGGDGGK